MSVGLERWRGLRDLLWTPSGLLGGFATLVTLGAAGTLFGLPGILAGIGVLLAWVAVSELAAFVVGQVASVAIVPPASVPLSERVLAVELGLFALLAASTLRTDRPVRGGSIFVVLAATLAGVVLIGVRVDARLWLVSTALVAATGVLLYGLHRYELVALGVVDEAETA